MEATEHRRVNLRRRRCGYPVLRDADSLSLAEITCQVSRLAERATERRLVAEETSGGVLSVSNPGKQGLDAMALVPKPPETAVLGVGRCGKKPVVVGEEIEVRWMMSLSLSFDRWMIDEAKAAKFLTQVGQLLEHPTLLVT